MPKIRPFHFALGVAGIALIRNWLENPSEAEAAAMDLTELVERAKSPAFSFELDIPDMDVAAGYEAWAPTYDSLFNPLTAIEERVVSGFIDSLPAGTALDAACGTGRWAKFLASRGHQVIGVDATSAMLEKARAAVPNARFLSGTLESIPLDAASIDFAICALALTHVADLNKPIAEIARVLKPGGVAIISDHHPMACMLGGSAVFQDAEGRYKNVRSLIHTHSEYVTAFVSAGLEIRACHEPLLTEREVSSIALFRMAPSAFLRGQVGLPFALIWMLRRSG